ncbi:MAG: acyltransferase [Gemmatimonadetes bacterium]|nr:acyltransferase [Gemmatimonadota bacterium]
MATRPERTVLPERNLDVLRAIAVLSVFLDHLTGAIGLASDFTRWLGQSGVLAFFVHTSLVLMASLERDGAPDRGHWIRRFYLRRAFRIYPLAWVVIAVVIVLHVPRGSLETTWEPVGWWRALVNFALVQNLTTQATVLAPLWTLPLELQMYAVLPFAYLVARRPAVAPMAALLVGGAALAPVFIWSDGHHVPQIWRATLFLFVPCFLMGVLAFWMLRRRAGRVPPLPAWAWIPIILTDIAVTSLAWDTGPRWILRVAFCAALGVAIPFVRDAADGWFTRAAHQVAVYSYGIYLIHLLAIRVGFGVLRAQPMVVQWGAMAVVLVGAVYAAYHLVEKPGIALGQRLAGGRLGAPSLESTAPAP